MSARLLDEHAYAILSLTTRLAWSPELPQPLPRSVVRRMLDSGALFGLILREMPGIEEKWFAHARMLLTRVREVASCIQAYEQEGWQLLFPGRADWPGALDVLGPQTPLFLFAKGNTALLAGRMIALAGSRKILRETQSAAERTGRMIASEGMVLVTGGAQGADSAAQRGAFSAGGGVVLVPALPVAQLMANPLLSSALESGKLLLLCDALPDEPFSAKKALERNHTIYALGEAALVVAARKGRGGSWRGAVDCMRGRWRPVYVFHGDNEDTLGNRALKALGAKAYTLDRPLPDQLVSRRQTSLFDHALKEEGPCWQSLHRFRCARCCIFSAGTARRWMTR